MARIKPNKPNRSIRAEYPERGEVCEVDIGERGHIIIDHINLDKPVKIHQSEMDKLKHLSEMLGKDEETAYFI